jgi:hypothetical protein
MSGQFEGLFAGWKIVLKIVKTVQVISLYSVVAWGSEVVKSGISSVKIMYEFSLQTMWPEWSRLQSLASAHPRFF